MSVYVIMYSWCVECKCEWTPCTIVTKNSVSVMIVVQVLLNALHTKNEFFTMYLASTGTNITVVTVGNLVNHVTEN